MPVWPKRVIVRPRIVVPAPPVSMSKPSKEPVPPSTRMIGGPSQPGCVVPSIATESVIVGSALPMSIWCWPDGGMLKVMTSAPELAFAFSMALRRLQSFSGRLQASPLASPVLSTTKVALKAAGANARPTAHAARTDSPSLIFATGNPPRPRSETSRFAHQTPELNESFRSMRNPLRHLDRKPPRRDPERESHSFPPTAMGRSAHWLGTEVLPGPKYRVFRVGGGPA